MPMLAKLGRRCRATRTGGPSRSSGTACARSATRSRAACGCARATCNDITARYPELARLNRALSHHRVILDGEVVAFDASGRPDFGALQRRMHVGSESAQRRLAKELPVTYVIFDLLWLDGHPLTHLPYRERRARAGRARPRARRALAGARPRRRRRARSCWRPTEEQGLEGVIAKRLDSTLRARAPQRRRG